MSGLALFLLGPPRVELEGKPLELKRRKVLALLAYLAVTAQRHSRDSLVELLYPDHDRERAFSDFRQTLSVLKHDLGEQWLASDRVSVSLAKREDSWTDVEEFQRLAASVRGAEGPASGASGPDERLVRAADLVRGEFLAGFYLRDSAGFDDWQSSQADSLRREAVYVLGRLVESLEARGEYQEAISRCQRLLDLEPLEEVTHRRLMRLHGLAGQRRAALAQYERCRRLLAKEPGGQPSEETAELAKEIARGSLGRTGRRAAPAPPPTGLFVGREPELARIDARVQQAQEGTGGMLVLVGEAGIGKTWLLEQAAAAARTRGLEVLWGRCPHEAGVPPLWPWRQLLGALAQQCGREQLRRWLSGRAAPAVQFWEEPPEGGAGPAAARKPVDADSARFRLFDAAATFLRAAAADKPFVLILDDLHWADSASLTLLEFMAPELGNARLLVLAACRDPDAEAAPPLAATLAELRRHRSHERLRIAGLARPEIGRLVELILGKPARERFADALWDRTRGNPLFAVEILRSTGDRGVDSIPATVQATIGRRLESFSPDCREALRFAAVLGPDPSAALLGQAMGLSVKQTALRLAEAIRARVLLEDPEAPGRYRFSHPLVQECVEAELAGARRAELHAKILGILEAHYGETLESHAAELVHHAALALPVLAPDVLAAYCRLAGEQALASGAHEDALHHFREGLAARSPDTRDELTAWLHFGVARALLPSPDVLGVRTEIVEETAGRGAYAALSAAFDCFEKSGDTVNAVRVAEHPLFWTSRGTGEYRTLCDRGLALAEPGSLAEARLLWLKGIQVWHTQRDLPAVLRLYERALDAAVRYADRKLELHIMYCWGTLSRIRGPWDVGAAKIQRAVQLLHEVDEPGFEPAVRFVAYHFALWAGDLPLAHSHIEASLAAAGRIRSAFWRNMSMSYRVEMAWVEGDWTAMRAASDEAIARAEDPQHWRQHLVARALLEHEVGNGEAASRFLERYLAEMRSYGFGMNEETTSAVYHLALMFRVTGDQRLLDTAHAAAVAAFGQTGSGSLWVRGSHMAELGLALIAYLTGDRAAAASRREWVNGAWLEPPGLGLTRPRLLGLLDMTLGNTEAAVADFEQALIDHAAQRHGPNGAWVCSELAEALLARGRAGDALRATELLNEGLETALRLGMPPLEGRLRRLIAVAKEKPAVGNRAPAHPA